MKSSDCVVRLSRLHASKAYNRIGNDASDVKRNFYANVQIKSKSMKSNVFERNKVDCSLPSTNVDEICSVEHQSELCADSVRQLGRFDSDLRSFVDDCFQLIRRSGSQPQPGSLTV